MDMTKDQLSDAQMIANKRMWPGETLCMKKQPKPGEKVGVMGYSEFGVITTNKLPIIIYLRPNFVREQKYDSIEALLDDGWIVD